MKKFWKNRKEKKAAEKPKILEERAVRYIQEYEKSKRLIKTLEENESELSKQQEDSTTAEINLAFMDSRDNSTKEEIKVGTNDKTKNNPKEKIIYNVRPDVPERNQSTPSVNERPVKRSRKRCHFCRKRGHVQKDCLSKRVLRKRLRDEAREMYQNTMQ